MTTDELRDWHANRQGWEAVQNHWHHKKYGCDFFGGDHPVPPTIDAAYALIPEGWTWGRSVSPVLGPELRWFAQKKSGVRSDLLTVTHIDTGDHLHDVLTLAKLAIEEEAKARIDGAIREDMHAGAPPKPKPAPANVLRGPGEGGPL